MGDKQQDELDCPVVERLARKRLASGSRPAGTDVAARFTRATTAARQSEGVSDESK